MSLGVRYVLEGTVRKSGGRVRITAQLIDALNGAHLWADRFDGSLEDVFDLQDKVAIDCRRGDRAGIASRGGPPLRQPSDERPYRLRSLSARCFYGLIIGQANSRSAGSS